MTSDRQFTSSKRYFSYGRKVLENLETCLEDVYALFNCLTPAVKLAERFFNQCRSTAGEHFKMQAHARHKSLDVLSHDLSQMR